MLTFYTKKEVNKNTSCYDPEYRSAYQKEYREHKKKYGNSPFNEFHFSMAMGHKKRTPEQYRAYSLQYYQKNKNEILKKQKEKREEIRYLKGLPPLRRIPAYIKNIDDIKDPHEKSLAMRANAEYIAKRKLYQQEYYKKHVLPLRRAAKLSTAAESQPAAIPEFIHTLAK